MTPIDSIFYFNIDQQKNMNVIYADPPQPFKTYSDKEDRSPEKHYPVLTSLTFVL